MSLMNRLQRCSICCLAMLCCGVLPLEVEISYGWGKSVKIEHLKCVIRENVENEEHFIFFCKMFESYRTAFFIELNSQENRNHVPKQLTLVEYLIHTCIIPRSVKHM